MASNNHSRALKNCRLKKYEIREISGPTGNELENFGNGEIYFFQRRNSIIFYKL
jgi:hypothetical protein